jgi:hypothetical protein
MVRPGPSIEQRANRLCYNPTPGEFAPELVQTRMCCKGVSDRGLRVWCGVQSCVDVCVCKGWLSATDLGCVHHTFRGGDGVSN